MNQCTHQKVIKNKLGLLELSKELGNVSRACHIFGYSRDSFYRFKKLYEEHGEAGLQEVSRKKPNLKNRVPIEIEEAVVKFALEEPGYGQFRVSNELKKKGIFVSSQGIRNIWIRNKLNTMSLRLKALEEKVAKEGGILTEKQLRALEKQKAQKEAHGEIETLFPGYLGAQDTYFVGTIKGVGKIYQQTFIDTYSKVSLCKLYDRKNALVAADLLNDKVIPFFEEQEIKLLRMLTDRGSEYRGNKEQHEYELYCAVEEIEHSCTKAYSPQSNGICERLHRTIQQEFYNVAFRSKIYKTIEELQKDLDHWLEKYNNERTHQGKHCLGETPMGCFNRDRHLAKQKMIGYNTADSDAERELSDSLLESCVAAKPEVE
ncbi:MAG: IS481 family transposase [Ignavibacteriae bacterium]|nr:IS481 family transposase [Ignavibacteriota bacterium]